MTHDETRDELYRIKALSDLVPGHGHDMEWARAHWDEAHCRWCDRNNCHPFPPTLDGANAAVPEGYEWERDAFQWYAWKHGSRCNAPVTVEDTGNPMDDLYALALKCRRAMEERK